ncbi:MAG: RloB family protein [Acidimicrobiaceae bacterium]|nr:RloB family protein [Acidimicrobiaceae bacterium]
MPQHRRRDKPLRRRAPRRNELPRFVIFCEGELTEPLYLKAFAALDEVRGIATLDIRGMGYEPRRLVEEARVVKRSERGQATGATEYWCVFDVEAPTQHARLKEAVQMARDNDISVAISNPSFELWLVLHCTDYENWINNDNCRSLRRKHDNSQGKSLIGAAYMPRRHQAITRARRLAILHASANREFPNDNPSSSVYLLMEAVYPTEDQQ